MRTYEVIESKVWVRDDGMKASIYGAVPWTSEEEESRWKMITNGWVIVNPDGTIGQGHPPCKTRKEAQDKADKWNTQA